jgi:hypothetical protein
MPCGVDLAGGAFVDERQRAGGAGAGHEATHELGVDLFIDESAARGHAGLAGVHGDAVPERVGGELGVGVAQNERAVTAGEFERAGREAGGEGLGNGAADVGAAGEDDMVEGVVAEERRAGLAAGVGAGEPAVGHVRFEAGFEGEIEEQGLRARGVLGGLDGDAVTGGDGLDQLDAEELDGVVPGGDDGDAAEGRAGDDAADRGREHAAAGQAAGFQDAGAVLLDPSAGGEQRGHVADEALEARLGDVGVHRLDQVVLTSGDEAAEGADPVQAAAQGPGDRGGIVVRHREH